MTIKSAPESGIDQFAGAGGLSGATPALSDFRMQRAEVLCALLAECHPNDAAAICAAFLEACETGGPRHDPLGFVYGDAKLWAEAAPPHELAAYVIAGLEKCRRRAFGLVARKRLFAAIWETLPERERLAFLARVDANGKFHRRVE